MTDKNQRDNIQVSIRIKPLLEESRSCIRLDQNLKNTIIIEGQQDPKYFYFDYVAQQEASQEDIFNIVGKQQAINCLDGYNGCVFVYGQTGSGKTYTMMGTQKQPGLLPRVIDFLFSCIDQSENVEFLLKCSYLEIYNEHIIDLLNPSLGNLQLREDLKKGVYVEQLSEEVCTNVNESLEVLQRGSLNRHISSTQMNIESSRSHSVFTIQLESRRQSSQTQVINHRFSRFHFVDLAGSERQKQSQVQGDRLREGCNINRSLHILGNVINSLVEDNQSYVHYRDSKLTFLLKDSLGGNSRTHLIANIQQSQQFFQETLSTLMFSKRVKQVKNKARINEDESGNLESLKNEIKRLKQELAKSVTQQQVWDSPKKFEQKSVVNEQFLQSLELESLIINDQRYIKLEEILKCYLEQSTESETALFLEIEKYLSGIKQLKEGFLLGQQLEQQLKFVIKLQNEQIAKLKQNQSAEDIQAQIQQQLSYALQCQGLVMKTFHENLTLREQQGCTQAVSKAQIQVDSNITLLKDIIETVQNSLNERRQFQQQLDQQFNSQYVTLEKFKQLESESEYKEQLLSEQTLKLVKMEEAIKETEKQFLQRLSENGITLDENDQIVDVRDKQIGDLKNRVSDLNIELTTQNQELENVLNTSESAINQLKTENLQLELQLNLKQDQINEQNTNLTNLKQQIDKMDKQIKQLESDNKNLEDNVKDIKQSLITEQNKNSQLSQQLNNEILVQKALIASKDNEIEDLWNQLREQIKKFEDSCNTVQEYVSIQQEQQASLELLEKQLESKQAVIQETSDHYNQVHELYIALQTRMEQKDQANGELRKEVNQQKSIIESLQKENQQKLTAVESEYQQSRATLEIQQQGKLQDMTQKLQNKMKTIESLTIEKNSLNEKVRDLDCELNKYKLMNSNMELQIGEQQKLVQALQTQAQGLKNQLQDEKNQLEQLQSEYDQQSQSFDKNLELWKQETENLESENASFKIQLNEKQKELNKLEAALYQLQSTLAQRDSQIDELENQSEGQNQVQVQQIEQLSKENIQLKKQIQLMGQQIESQQEEIQAIKKEFDQKSVQAEESKQNVKKLTKQLDLEIKQYSTHMKKFDDQHKKEIQEVVDQLDILQKQLRIKEQVIEQLNKQLSGMQNAFETKDDITLQSQKEMQQLKDKLKSDQNKFTKIIQGLENANNLLKNQLDESTHLNSENVLKIQSGQKQYEMLNIQYNELQEKYTSLKDQMLRFESQIKQESQIREQYSHIADKVTKENNELKSKLDKKQQIITQLEQALLQNEETLKNVHDRAKDFCKQQEKEINDIKDQYLKLEAEHNAILSQNQEREDENEQIKDQKDQAVMQMQAIEEELMKTKRELSDQHEKLTKANNERSMLYKQIEEMQRDIAQLGGHNNPSQKIRYLNTIKQENSCLKQEKLYLSEQLQKEIEEKNKLLEKKKQTEQENQQNIAKLDMQKLVIENQRLNNEMSKLNQILNLSGIKNRYSTIKGSDGDKIIQSVQLLIQELIDCKQEIQLRNKEQEGKNLKYQTMEKDLLVMKQKFYAVQKDSGHQIQTKAQSPGVQPDVLRDNNRITINSGSVQRQSKPKGQQTFQFQ